MSGYRSSPARAKPTGEYGSVSIVSRIDLTNTIKRFDVENPEVIKKEETVSDNRAGRNFVNLKNVLLISLAFFILLVCLVAVIDKQLLFTNGEDGLEVKKSNT